jgi:hypothetical protein
MRHVVFWVIVIFLIELGSSYCADAKTVKIVARRKYLAIFYNSLAEGLAWLALIVIVVNRLYFPYVISAVAGSTLGTWFIASRKVKINNKKIVHRKKKGEISDRTVLQESGRGTGPLGVSTERNPST